MNNQQIARQMFEARDRAMIELTFRGIGDEQEINERFSYRHGWISVNGEGFNRDTAFPEKFFPRFPADQGLSD